VTWHIGFSENVSLTQMQDFHTKLTGVNEKIYQISEGQVQIGMVKYWDNVGPGTTSQEMGSIDTSNLDCVVWPDGSWNGPGLGYVIYGPGYGRVGRCIGVPEGCDQLTLVHEGSHFLWELTWSAGPGLTDEYAASPQDNACVMELTWNPLRWCASDNHLGQSTQPTSCWQQILDDYPSFSYGFNDTASGSATAPGTEYNDSP
jgi:hypothetical protein